VPALTQRPARSGRWPGPLGLTVPRLDFHQPRGVRRPMPGRGRQVRLPGHHLLLLLLLLLLLSVLLADRGLIADG
jgi:hypothetical protein